MGELWERLADLEEQIFRSVPPIDPAPLYWLHSDATFAYCWPCAREAAWRELPSIGPAPAEKGYFERDALEELIRDRIDGGFDGSGDDSPQTCETCRCTLSHTLTDYGVEEELAHFEEGPIERLTPETSYELSRIFLNLTQPAAEYLYPEILPRAVKVAEQAIEAIRQAETEPA